METKNEPEQQAAPAYTQPEAPPGYRLFPSNTFGLYSAGMMNSNMFLGASKDERLHAVTFPSGFKGEQPIIIRQDTDPTSAPLAEITLTYGHKRMNIELPLEPGTTDKIPLTEHVQTTERDGWDGWHHKYTFSVAVPVGSHEESRSFQWCHGSDHDVKALGQRNTGWKLVCAPSDSVSSAAAGDGSGEVLMVWAEPKVGIGAFTSKAVTYEFVGAGATGELGRRWEIMAVATAVGIFDAERQQNRDVSYWR